MDNIQNISSSSSTSQFVLSRNKMNKFEYRAVITLLTKQGKNPKIINEEMLFVNRDDCLPKLSICKWSKLFEDGRNSLDDDLYLGHHFRCY